MCVTTPSMGSIRASTGNSHSSYTTPLMYPATEKSTVLMFQSIILTKFYDMFSFFKHVVYVLTSDL